MSRRVHDAPLALAADGTVLVNVLEMFDLDASPSVVELAEAAVRARGRVFVGVQLSRAEARRALEGSRDRYAEIAAQVVGGRRTK